jgi:hypothetical protein
MCWPEALSQIGISGLAIIIIKRLSFHLRFTAPEAVFPDGYRAIRGIYSRYSRTI